MSAAALRNAALRNGVTTPAAGGTPPARPEHSLVLAADYRVDDVAGTWSLIQDNHSPLAGLGAHHAVLYTSTLEPDRVLVTIGIRHRESVEQLLRSPAFFEWFDRAGVNDLPAIFVGEVAEKIDVPALAADSAAGPVTDRVAGVIVGAVAPVADVAGLMTSVHGGLQRFRDSGVRKVWVYRAIDDGNEVLTLLEVDNAASAERWISRPDAAAEWMSGVGIGGYPRPFVGKLAFVMNFEVMDFEATNPEATR